MKLRCTTNSIRIRVRKSELAQLATEHQLQDTVTFPDGTRFVFAITIADNLAEVQADFREQTILVQLPTAVAKNWFETSLVSIASQQPLPDGEALEILVEKDFPCKDRTEEDPADFFEELSEASNKAC